VATILKYDRDVTINQTATIAVTKGLLYGITNTGAYILADRTTPTKAVGFAIADNLSTDIGYLTKAVGLSPCGVIDFADNTAVIAGGAFTIGSVVYLDTAGGYTTTKPVTNGNLHQPVGVALTTTRAFIHMTQGYLLAQTAGNSNIGV